MVLRRRVHSRGRPAGPARRSTVLAPAGNSRGGGRGFGGSLRGHSVPSVASRPCSEHRPATGPSPDGRESTGGGLTGSGPRWRPSSWSWRPPSGAGARERTRRSRTTIGGNPCSETRAPPAGVDSNPLQSLEPGRRRGFGPRISRAPARTFRGIPSPCRRRASQFQGLGRSTCIISHRGGNDGHNRVLEGFEDRKVGPCLRW
jgi:hypothetical protein